jgi:hypothetical protein
MRIVLTSRRVVFTFVVPFASACGGAGSSAVSPAELEACERGASGGPRLCAGPPESQSLAVDPCVFGDDRGVLQWRVTAADDYSAELFVKERWAKVGADRVSVDDRAIAGKTIPLKRHVPFVFPLELGTWTPHAGDELSLSLWAKIGSEAEFPVPNSSCTVPSPPPR